MASADVVSKRIQVGGENEALVSRLREPLQRALAERQTCYAVRVEGLGRVGQVLVSITGSKGRLPLLFGPEELEPGNVSRVVHDVVERLAF